MLRRASVKGQGLIFVVIVLFVVIAILALIFTSSVHVRAAPSVQEAFWTFDDHQVSTANIGQTVEAHIVVEATGEYVGTIVSKVRKDIAIWPDSDYQVSSTPVNLKGGEQKEIVISFMPDQASTGRLRGYFIEVDFKVTGTEWAMEKTYPPRLKVSD